MEKQNDALIAILIDADNVSASYLDVIMDETTKYGICSIKRIYGDWTKPNLASWKSHLLEHAISPIQQFSYTSGKNSTDSALIIDAMDMLYTSDIDIFFLVSSDSDFTKLATRLRESGKQVYGIGEEKTPMSFISACNRFFFLEILAKHYEDAENIVEREFESGMGVDIYKDSRTSDLSQKKLYNLVASSIDDLSDDDGYAFLGDVGNLILKKQPSFDPRHYGYKKLSSLLKNLNGIEIDERPTKNPGVKHIYIRYKFYK